MQFCYNAQTEHCTQCNGRGAVKLIERQFFSWNERLFSSAIGGSHGSVIWHYQIWICNSEAVIFFGTNRRFEVQLTGARDCVVIRIYFRNHWSRPTCTVFVCLCGNAALRLAIRHSMWPPTTLLLSGRLQVPAGNVSHCAGDDSELHTFDRWAYR